MASACRLDERVDVWSLGCLLYFAMHGVSPFEQVPSRSPERGCGACLVIRNAGAMALQSQRVHIVLQGLVIVHIT